MVKHWKVCKFIQNDKNKNKLIISLMCMVSDFQDAKEPEITSLIKQMFIHLQGKGK